MQKESDEDVGEDEDEVKRRLYECDTEVESDDSSIEVESKEDIKESVKNDDSFVFDSDPDTDVIHELPKRNRISKKSSNDKVNSKTIDSEKEFSGNCADVFKPKNIKRLSKGRETTNCVDEPGPSGVKISKMVGSSKEVSLLNEKEIMPKSKPTKIENHLRKDNTTTKQSEVNFLNSLHKGNENSLTGSHHGFSHLIANNGDKNKHCESISGFVISENHQNVSTVDDIISNLID